MLVLVRPKELKRLLFCWNCNRFRAHQNRIISFVEKAESAEIESSTWTQTYCFIQSAKLEEQHLGFFSFGVWFLFFSLNRYFLASYRQWHFIPCGFGCLFPLQHNRCGKRRSNIIATMISLWLLNSLNFCYDWQACKIYKYYERLRRCGWLKVLNDLSNLRVLFFPIY